MADVVCTSVAWLFWYLNNDEEEHGESEVFWQPGQERFGYTDALFEMGEIGKTGGHLHISVDSGDFRLHPAIHELGHSVSYMLNDDLFYDFFDIAMDTSEKPPTEYGKTEVAEDFAESYAMYFIGGKSRETLLKTCPKRYKVMQAIDNSGKNAVVSSKVATIELHERFQDYDEAPYANETKNYKADVIKHDFESAEDLQEKFVKDMFFEHVVV